MQSGFVGTVCRMGVFLICAQAVVHFRPKAVYEKYLKMLVSAMVLIQLLSGIGGLFSKSGQGEFSESAKWFAENSLFPVPEGGYDMDMKGELFEGWEEENRADWKAFTGAAPVPEVRIPKVQISEISVSADRTAEAVTKKGEGFGQ